MKFYVFIIYYIAFSTNSFGQLNEASSLTRIITNKIEQNKKHKLAQKYAAKKWIYNDSIDMLRVPNEKVKSKMALQIGILQTELDTAYNCYITKRHIKKNKIENYIYLLKSFDPNWPSSYYSIENNNYLLYDQNLNEQERTNRKIFYERRKKTEDSLEVIENANRKRVEDSLNLVAKHRAQKNLSGKSDYNVTNSNINNPSQSNSTKNKFKSSSGNHQYRTGPRGGCYYINSSGKKVYVDRSYCN